MPEIGRADLERRLRIRQRNLERLNLEAKYIADDEAPPAVLERIQSQIRVEEEEIRLVENRISDLDNRGRGRSGSEGGSFRLSERSMLFVRVLLALLVVAVLVVVLGRVVPRTPADNVSLDVPATYTPAPTYTGVASAATHTRSPSPVATDTPALIPTPTVTLTPTEPAPTEPPPTQTLELSSPVGAVNVDVLNLRGGPDTTYGIRAKLMLGEKLNLLGRNELGTWLAVSTLDGATGWVAVEYVDVNVMVDELVVKDVEEQG